MLTVSTGQGASRTTRLSAPRRAITVAVLRAKRTALRSASYPLGVLHVRFDHPEGLVHTARDLGEQVGCVSVVQRRRIIDGFTCAATECRERILHRPNVSPPVTDVEGVFPEL